MLKFHNIKSNSIFQNIFENNNIHKLIYLYQLSHYENQRNNRLTAEVGTSREKDIIAYMIFILNKSNVQYKIDNEKEEDIIVNGRKISIKHSSNKTCSSSSIKVQWTENRNIQNKLMKKFHFKCDILLIYVRFDKCNIKCGQLEILYISNELLNNIKKQMKNIFKTRNSNGRGIEFSSRFFDKIIHSCNYHSIIDFEVTTYNILGPIDRRLQLIEQKSSSYKQWEKADVKIVIRNAAQFFNFSVLLVKKCFVYLVYKCKFTTALI